MSLSNSDSFGPITILSFPSVIHSLSGSVREDTRQCVLRLVTVVKLQELDIVFMPQQQGCDLSLVVVLLPPHFVLIMKL